MLRSVTIFFKNKQISEFVIFFFYIYIFKRKCNFPHILIAVMEWSKNVLLNW